MERDRLRDALAILPTGVAIVSAAHGGGWRGVTASTLVPVSLDPPLLLVALEEAGQALEAVRGSAAFNASLLERSQGFLAERFAGRAPAVDPAWREVPHEVRGRGLPVVAGCVAWFACSVAEVHPAGDHALVIGRVEDCARLGGDPLVYWDRAFWQL